MRRQLYHGGCLYTIAVDQLTCQDKKSRKMQHRMQLTFLPLNIGMVLHFEFHSSRSQIFFFPMRESL